MVGDSLESIVQLNIAPETGIKNFHRLISETFTSGLCNTVNHKEKAAADRKDNHPNER